jgi:endonuclease/exonuclease/phosphatase family metal-dependent hydrolase
MRTAELILVALGFACSAMACAEVEADEVELEDENSESSDLQSTVKDGFKVMSYNVRKQADDDVLAGNEEHRWWNRRTHIRALIAKQNPDVVGFQEVRRGPGGDAVSEASQTSLILNNGEDVIAFMTELGYASFIPTGASPKLIFFKPRFTQIAAGQESLEVPSKNPDCNPDKQVAWVRLLDQVNQKEVLIANTHFTPRSACGAVREQQAVKLHNAVDVARTVGTVKLPVIVMGDFNAEQKQKQSGSKSEGTFDVLDTTYKYQVYKSDALRYAPTFNQGWDDSGSNDSARIDYLFYKGLEAGTYKVVKTLVNISFKTAKGSNKSVKTSPSDHYPVMQTFGF